MAQETESEQSTVLIIMTGGTICMQKSSDGTFVPARGFHQRGLAPRPSFNDGSIPAPCAVADANTGRSQWLPTLQTPVSRYGRSVRYCVYEFPILLDSSYIDATGWAQIACTIQANYDLFHGFIVLHGTDTLAYSCSALSFMLQGLSKPVIFTGSQAPISELQNDATDNLLGSLIIAGHFKITEVCLFFNYKLFRGNRATKVSASAYNAFDSPNHPALATMSATGIDVQWHLIHQPNEAEKFSVQMDLDTTRVACLRIFPGIRAEMVDSVLRLQSIRGLVLQTFGAGNAPAGAGSAMLKVFSDAVDRDNIIVNVTQCLSGNVSPLYASAALLGQAGVVVGYDMTTEAALTKLSYLLAIPNLSTAEISKRMGTSLRGELTQEYCTQFQHPVAAARANL